MRHNNVHRKYEKCHRDALQVPYNKGQRAEKEMYALLLCDSGVCAGGSCGCSYEFVDGRTRYLDGWGTFIGGIFDNVCERRGEVTVREIPRRSLGGHSCKKNRRS